jgi:alpha-beta hydrolase superfamily lysophospholipase
MGAGLALLVVHGADDALCRVEGSRQLLALATGVPDRALIEYAGLLHEITSEREGGARVAADVIAWQAARATAAGGAATAAAAGAPPPAAG